MVDPVISSYVISIGLKGRVSSLTSLYDLRKLFAICSLLFISILPTLLFAQPTTADFKKISLEENGVPFNQFVAIVQDQEGFLWLSTNKELLKFNGYEVKVYRYNPADTSSLADNSVGKLYVDTEGDLWAGNRKGLSRYNHNCDCFVNYPLLSSFKSAYMDSVIQHGHNNMTKEAVFAITEDQNKQLWAATLGGDLFRYDRNKDIFLSISNSTKAPKSIPPLFINVLLADKHNNLWIGGGKARDKGGSGLIRLNLNTGEMKRFGHTPGDVTSLIDSRVTALLEDRQGRLLVGTFRGGLHYYHPETESFTRLKDNPVQPVEIYAPPAEEQVWGDYPPVNILHQDQKGGLWVGTWGVGLYHFEALTGKLTNYAYNNGQANSNSFVHNDFSILFEDRQGQVWLGSNASGGLFKKDIYAPQFTWYPRLKRAQRSCESISVPGTFWISSMGEGLHQLDRKTGEVKTYLHNELDPNSIGNNWVRAVYEDEDAILWIGVGDGGYGGTESGKGGLDRLDTKTGIFEHYTFKRKDLPDFYWTVYALHEDGEGRLWLDTGPGGLYRSDRQKKHFEPYVITGSEDSEIWVVSDNNTNALWATDYTKKVMYRYRPEQDQFVPIIQGDAAEAVLEDESGIWIPTINQGLLHVDPNRGVIQRFTEEDGLPANETMDIQSTEVGIYWVATRKGITKFNSHNKTFHNEGMPRGYFHPIWLKSKDAQLFFGADEGLVAFYPDKVEGNPIPPELAFQQLQISGEPFALVKEENGKYQKLHLASQQNDFSITYVGLHFSDPESNKYRYKLSPFDKDWIDAGTRRTIQYTNLQPGEYNFHVNAANRDGIWTEEALSLSFQIYAPWWQSWWSYTFSMAFIIGISYWFYRFQLAKTLAIQESKRLQEINQFKTKLYNNITHEFRTPLTVILGMTENLRSEVEQQQLDNFDSPLKMIERNSKNLLHLVNDMLDLAKIESGKLELNLRQADVIDFIKYLEESFDSLAEEKGIHLHMEAMEQSLIMDFDPDKLAVVVSNLLSNAIKFTPEGGEIVVRCKFIFHTDTDYFSITVKDNGIGIVPEEIPHLFDRFYQANQSVGLRYQGTGIGLALTKELVTLMKGSIQIESKSGKGSVFIVNLPITRNAPLAGNEAKGDFSLPHGSTSENNLPEEGFQGDTDLPLVLIIEDHKDVVRYIGICLQGKYQYLHASQGKIGIETAIEKIPDLIICDVMLPSIGMPGKDGFEVCATLKQDERTSHIPIILLTARVSLEDRLKGLMQGADAYLTKPFEKEELLIRLHQLFKLRKTLQKKYSERLLNDRVDETVIVPEDSFITKVRGIILSELENEHFSVDDLGERLYLSRSQLHRKIKAVTGMSTSIFIRTIRLQEAKSLLASSNLNISEIAYQVGFKTPVYFSQIFKKTFGESPGEYRK